jgi:ABC-type polysaccharide/polyol phosphate export permease
LTVEGGFLGMLGVTIVAAMFAAGIASIASAFAIRTGSSEAVLGAFPLLFSLMFISGLFFPRTLMDGWFKTAATINPLSHMVEGMRAQVITGLDVSEWLSAVVIAAGFFVVGLTLASLALRRRLSVSS